MKIVVGLLLFANLALNHSYYTSYTPQGGGTTLYGANV